MFTLGQNMFSLIANETCFTTKTVHIKAVNCANHDRNLFILSMIETTSQGSFDLNQTKHVNLVAKSEGEASS